MTTVQRHTIPELVQQPPLCPMCREETARETDGRGGTSFWCGNCGCHWPEIDATFGEWDKPAGPACGQSKAIQLYDLRTPTFVCVRDEGHGGWHLGFCDLIEYSRRWNDDGRVW